MDNQDSKPGFVLELPRPLTPPNLLTKKDIKIIKTDPEWETALHIMPDGRIISGSALFEYLNDLSITK